MQEQLRHLQDLAVRHAAGRRRTETVVPRVGSSLAHETTDLQPGLFEPMLCLVLQGAKEVTIGERKLRYDPATYFIATLDLPASGCIIEASAAKPYVGISLALDREMLAGLISDAPVRSDASVSAFDTSPVTPQLLDAWLRLMRLLDAPQDIAVLAPLFEREILYRLLQGPQRSTLLQIATADSRLSQVRRAIAWIRSHYDQALRIEALADMAGMSAASFHRHFKTATAMSPLQYQKNLRLQQARRLLIANQDAARVGYAVGYESASQFSREYARLFGAPPARDAMRLRGDQTGAHELATA
jgi:AraC-like DNA-binding protein